MVKIIECPRDAMQGLTRYISPTLKADYINLLRQVGFDTVDFGSFVSPHAIPQLRDTAEVLEKLDIPAGSSKLLAIVANTRGIEEAVKYEQIHYLGFPFSISETFQLRNTNSGIEKSLDTVRLLIEACNRSGKQAVIYLSMAFGNPYGEEWNIEIAGQKTADLVGCGAKIIALSDTTGVSTPENIERLFPYLSEAFRDVEFGVHLHSNPATANEKIEAAWRSGCRRFDSALGGFGGCPMATDALTGNIATEGLISFLEAKEEPTGLDMAALKKAQTVSSRIFNNA